ncbi:hypothetical protein KP509_05G061800 [Ceratopteris richardii]|uniref:DUF659 domain-containing protein n=1 Tax=Ceratopteris richardii TaxID=49495 RepID=A0A8T2UUG9_CERRI|nr:hypothetical protein KP509_05G061800 [Ceratopteris richardii]
MRYTSGATRLIQHLTKVGGQVAACKEIPDHIANCIRRKHLGLSSSGPSHVRGQGELGDAPGHTRTSLTWLKEKQKIADSEITKLVILESLSFNLLNSKQWKATVKAISEVGPCQGWTGPSYSDLRRRKIDEEKKKIDLSLLPMREKWSRYGCTILSDGWRDRKNRSMINILVSCPIGTFFLRAVEVGKKGKKTTGAFIYRHIKKAIEEVGAKNVVQVVTDNASNCRHMGKLLEEEYKHIVWTPCATHCLDLLMEDIGKLSWVKACTQKASSMVTFFTQKGKVLSMFREHSKLEIKKPATTRFAYMWIVLSRLLEVRIPLRQTVVSPLWNDWDESSLEESKSMQRLCLDEEFWENVKAVLNILTPIYRVLRMTDCESATLGLLIHMMRRAIDDIRAATLVTTEQANEVLETHSWIAGLLHPAFKSPALYTDIKLLSDRLSYMSRVVPSHLHNEMLEQISCYLDERGNSPFTFPSCWDRALMVKPLFWWQNFGFSFSTLSTYAIRVLSQDCSSGAYVRQTRSRTSTSRGIRVVRGRGKGLIIRRGSSSHGEEASTSRAPLHTATYMRRTILPARHHSSRFDDEGNVISPIESPVSSTYEMTSEDSLDEQDDSDDDIE